MEIYYTTRIKGRTGTAAAWSKVSDEASSVCEGAAKGRPERRLQSRLLVDAANNLILMGPTKEEKFICSSTHRPLGIHPC